MIARDWRVKIGLYVPREYADIYLHIYFSPSKSNSAEDEAKIFTHCIFKKMKEDGLAFIPQKTKEAIVFQKRKMAI